MKSFVEVAGSLAGVPVMSAIQGRRVYDHLVEAGAKDILELGTAHGVSACYMACAVQGKGKVTTVDHVDATKLRDPQPADVIARAGLSDTIELVLVEDSSYTWWLKNQVAANSDENGNCTPIYDFCYLDGAHNFTIDGLSVILIEKLLRPGGWLLVDDLTWLYRAQNTGVNQGPQDLRLSPAEIAEPHMQVVFDVLIRSHPNFTLFRVENDDWGWAKKDPGSARTFEVVATTPSLKTRSLQALRRIRPIR